MSTRAALGVSLLLTFMPADPAGAADKPWVQTLGTRLAAGPAGEEAEALAKDVRAWFGKDRNGRNNVVNGANPHVEGLETAWATDRLYIRHFRPRIA